jgi:hypothetical protein
MMLLLSILALLLPTPPAGASEGDEPDSTPVVLMDLESYELYVKTNGTSPYELHSNGTVTAGSVGVGSNVQSIRVDLEANSGMGYTVELQPTTMIFPPQGGVEDFEWTLYIPSLKDVALVIDSVLFGGRAVTVPGGLATPIDEEEAVVEIHSTGWQPPDQASSTREPPESFDYELPGYEAPVVLGAFIAITVGVILAGRRRTQ